VISVVTESGLYRRSAGAPHAGRKSTDDRKALRVAVGATLTAARPRPQNALLVLAPVVLVVLGTRPEAVNTTETGRLVNIGTSNVSNTQA
jgi:hypothetical protein